MLFDSFGLTGGRHLSTLRGCSGEIEEDLAGKREDADPSIPGIKNQKLGKHWIRTKN